MKKISEIALTEEQISRTAARAATLLVREFPSAPGLCVRLAIMQATLDLMLSEEEIEQFNQAGSKVARICHESIAAENDRQEKANRRKSYRFGQMAKKPNNQNLKP